ncbi:L-serine ammonia-lyase, iron-sulfur-dependent, subunit alpha [Lactococcus kimchii]|uniref:L-serine ammonia-lyase, iron-sulfur-dependent, subunit alpha n=1 Tax=Lactococcus sp. S-13 TaxID=2507158 RepID=UPI001023B9D8|nr:L-serine ammonia-lyase, iron-sulfur-dependent, subunit alpha [Lactococcus sp. S-13]RZI48523.1 L-serine ammonia-lyase, iron-sulfur-dependent, subunit alpha [Lactococcus sp. S-13]
MFKNIEELMEDAKNYPSVAELMIAVEIEQTGRDRAQIWSLMERNLTTMLDSVAKGLQGQKSLTGLTGGDAKLMEDYIQSGKSLSGDVILGAARDAVAVNEVNAQMGLICATPTAGSAGCLPGVLTSAIKTLNLTHEQQIEFLFTAGAFGLAIANNATISGAEGGCQAEVGSASAMASAALVLAAGGSTEQAGYAIALVLQNMLGLICDPVAGLVEIPCVHRNAMGASQAMISADMALAGVKTVIPVDEVVNTMYNVGRSLPAAFRETAEGGLAQTPTGRRVMEEIFG